MKSRTFLNPLLGLNTMLLHFESDSDDPEDDPADSTEVEQQVEEILNS